MIRAVVRFVDQRTAGAPLIRRALRYLFPDHWSFLLGEVALYAFIVLVATGVYLTLFFEPSLNHVVYHGGYPPLRGHRMSEAYRSALDISFTVKAGDEVAVRESSKNTPTILSARDATAHAPAPGWMDVDRDGLKARINGAPRRDELVQIPINEQLIVELYSK